MAVILVVDDEEANRALLRALLASSGHTVIEARDGREALDLVVRQPPDLVLLDVMMPGLDGFEVTRRLRASGDGRFLPVVLVTALTDQSSRRLGLAAGADEFLTKPVDPQELSLRVRNLLALRAKGIELAARNAELVELQRFKDELTAFLVHDLKNPLAVLTANLEFLSEEGVDDPDQRAAIDDGIASTRRLNRLLVDMADTQRLEAARFTPVRKSVDASAWLAPIATSRRREAEARDVTVVLNLQPECAIHVDPTLMTRVVENLLDNAMRYTPWGGRIVIEAARRDGEVHVAVGNTGTAIPCAEHARIFEKYGQRNGSGRLNLGLGLYFCRLAVEAHGGRITIDSSPELATRFVIRIPVVDD